MKYKWCQRIARAMLPCFVFFVFSFSFAPKAYAADADVNVGYGFYGGPGATLANYVNSASSPVIEGRYTFTSSGGPYVGDAIVYTDSNTLFYDNVKIYASYYFNNNYYTSFSALTGHDDISNWVFSYINDFGETGTTSLDDFRIVSGNSSAVGGNTYVLEGSAVGSELHPIRELKMYRPDKNTGYSIGLRYSGGSNGFTIVFPSVRVITTQYSAEMEALDNLANEIAAQSDILLAMKGDLVAILQDIYQMTGDMYEAQLLLNSYIAQLLPLIQDIDQTTTNIYNLLSTQLRLLETAIENAASSIEAAIAAQTAAMIAYLDQFLNTGNEVPDDTYQQQQDAENILDQMGALGKPDVESIVPVIDDYSDSGVSGVLSAIFSSNLIVTMMTLSASFAFGAYVLFGKRE